MLCSKPVCLLCGTKPQSLDAKTGWRSPSSFVRCLRIAPDERFGISNCLVGQTINNISMYASAGITFVGQPASPDRTLYELGGQNRCCCTIESQAFWQPVCLPAALHYLRWLPPALTRFSRRT